MAYAHPDGDGDGLPDDWESHHGATLPGADPDGDGIGDSEDDNPAGSGPGPAPGSTGSPTDAGDELLDQQLFVEVRSASSSYGAAGGGGDSEEDEEEPVPCRRCQSKILTL